MASAYNALNSLCENEIVSLKITEEYIFIYPSSNGQTIKVYKQNFRKH